MILKRFEPEHHGIVSDWWLKHNHPIMPLNELSPIGLMVYDNNEPICVSFLYLLSGTSMGQIGFTTSNPEATSKQKHKAIGLCLNGLISLSSKYERSSVVCFSSSKGLTKILKKVGLTQGATHDYLIGKVE